VWDASAIGPAQRTTFGTSGRWTVTRHCRRTHLPKSSLMLSNIARFSPDQLVSTRKVWQIHYPNHFRSADLNRPLVITIL
jgi:hypothetical protein